jgi:hypothetical protein
MSDQLSLENNKFKKEYLAFIKKAYELVTVLEENDNDINSPEFTELWKKMNAGIDIAELLDSVLYPKEFSDMINRVDDSDRLKVFWKNEMENTKIGDGLHDGIVVGVFLFTIWIYV